MITDSREDLTNSVAAAVKEHKGKFRGLDCNRGTKTKAAMKRWNNFSCYFFVYFRRMICWIVSYFCCRILHNLMNNDGRSGKQKEKEESITENIDSVS